jgi:membrane fusion protein, multidrug efflux system
MNSSVKILLTGLAAFAAGAALVFYFVKAAPKPAGEAAAEGPAATPIKLSQSADGEVVISLDAEMQKRIGLTLANPAPVELQPEIKAYGHVIDPAPLIELLSDFFRAEITFDKAHQEMERAKQLKQDSNISERAFQDAETTYKLDFADVSAIRQKIETQWGPRLAEMTGPIVVPPGTQRKPDEFLDKISHSVALIRIDLPVGEDLKNTLQPARIMSLAGKPPVTAACFDKLPAVDSQSLQQGLLLTADQSPTNRLTPGEAVTAFISIPVVNNPGKSATGVVVPSDAILRYEGKGWVYVQTGTNDFTRMEIPLDRPLNGGCFDAGGISATNRIIVTGAQTVLSAELSSGNFNSGSRD